MVELNRQFLVKIYGNRLQELTHIDVSDKKLIKINSNVFQGLTQLEILNLRHNKISEINGGLFESLSSLKELYLSNNKLKRIDSDTFKGLDKLETLALSENEIEVVASDAFTNFKSLKALNLNNNKLKEVDGQCFKPLKSIEVLELYENDFKYLSFITTSTDLDEWKYDRDKLKEYGFMSDWNQFLEIFSQLENDRIRDPYPGKIFNNRYYVKKCIASGEFGVIYLVDDKRTNTSKAMKIIKYDEGDNFLNMNELKLYWEINHENIVKYFDHFNARFGGENYIYLIIEYCENSDLSRKIKTMKSSNQTFEEKQILKWMCQATEALMYLHSKSIIHRDIKPSNMLLNETNDIKLAEFVVAKIMEKSHASTGRVGTDSYMSPEIYKENSYYPNTDIWSLGCVLYELIFLKLAFPKGQRRNPPLPSNISSSGLFSDILPMMLEKDNNVRITSNDLLFELDKLVDILQLDFRERDNIIDPYIGKNFNDKYEVVKKLGKGRYGLVYLVNEKSLNDKKVTNKAIKIMKSEEYSTGNEVSIFLQIEHENIVRYYDHFHKKINNEYYTFLIIEYCENGDLANKIRSMKNQNKSFEEDQILKWIRQATDALKYLHSRKPEPIIHRDIKPLNMLLTRRNDIKLADLGVAKMMETTHATTHAGTLPYMSPEVFKALSEDGISHYPNTDIWSLGCVLYELIFLKRVFPNGQKGNPELPSNVSNCGLFSDILPKMLEKDHTFRIESKELLALLDNLVVADKIYNDSF